MLNIYFEIDKKTDPGILCHINIINKNGWFPYLHKKITEEYGGEITRFDILRILGTPKEYILQDNEKNILKNYIEFYGNHFDLYIDHLISAEAWLEIEEMKQHGWRRCIIDFKIECSISEPSKSDNFELSSTFRAQLKKLKIDRGLGQAPLSSPSTCPLGAVQVPGAPSPGTTVFARQPPDTYSDF